MYVKYDLSHPTHNSQIINSQLIANNVLVSFVECDDNIDTYTENAIKSGEDAQIMLLPKLSPDISSSQEFWS